MRIKRGLTRHAHHNKIHKLSKGYRMSKHKLVKVSKEAILHAGAYAFAGRRKKKGDFRRLWILRINAGLAQSNLSYSKFIHMLKINNVEIDRKILSNLATEEPKAFQSIVDYVNKP